MGRYVFCYDIASDKRRRKVADCLDSYGDRVQESVFELSVSQRRFERCFEGVSALIDAAVDQVAVYQLCGSCEHRRKYVGANEAVRTIGEESVFIV